jgi:hypothetical protein
VGSDRNPLGSDPSHLGSYPRPRSEPAPIASEPEPPPALLARRRRTARWVFTLTLALYLGLGFGWLVRLPALEGPDEPAHLSYAIRLADGLAPPVIPGQAERLGRTPFDEHPLAHHPPLYYRLLALVEGLLFRDGLRPSPWPQPVPVLGERRGELIWSHGADEPLASPEQQRLALLRGLSLLMGLGVLLATRRLGHWLVPEDPRVGSLAALLLTLVPSWISTQVLLDNGNLAGLICALTLVLLAASVAQARCGPGRAALLALLVAIGLWTKLTSLILLPLLAGCALWLLRRGGWRAAWPLALALLASLACWSPWLLRNRELYGEWLGSAAHEAAYAGSRLPSGTGPAYLWQVLPRSTFELLVGGVGSSGLPVPVWLDAAWLVALLGGFLGLLAPPWRRPRAGGPLLLLTALLAAALYLRFNLVFRQPQPRYLFAAAPAIGLGLLLGWRRLLDRIPLARRVLPPALGALLGGGGLWMLAVAAPRAWGPRLSAPAPWYASLTAGLASQRYSQVDPELWLLAPADGAELAADTRLRWRPLEAGEPPLSLHVWTPGGPLIAGGYEFLGPQQALDPRAGEVRLPDRFWQAFPPGTRIHWKLRRLRDRSGAEPTEPFEESEVRTLIVPGRDR